MFSCIEPRVTEDFSECVEHTGYTPFKEFIKIRAFDNPNLPSLKWKNFSESIYETFEHLSKNKENDNSGWSLFAFLNKVTREREKVLNTKTDSRYT